MLHRMAHRVLLCLLVCAVATSLVVAQSSQTAQKKSRQKPREDPQQRVTSLRNLAEHLGVDAGSVIADIGAGNGRDTWTFAEIAGETGQVFAEEIDEGKVKKLKEEVDKRDLSQVTPVLGGPTDPKLPEGTVDMAFMHYVYHHMSKPREMLQAIWKSLKPGGYLVIVDRRLGTLVDWVPREQRATKHFWIAETTVVREGREEGFRFAETAEQCWHAKDTFVIVLQRPEGVARPQGDPDAPLALSENAVKQLLPDDGKKMPRVAFVALSEGRTLVAPLIVAMDCAAVDIVLEEFATRKDEVPPLPAGVDLPSVLTEQGDPQLGSEPLDAVYFLDSYHLLFHGPVLLSKLRERLTEKGRVYVLDRTAQKKLSRREASHRRRIAPAMVKQEFEEAGFTFVRQEPGPAEDRFLMLFQK
jgi:predicted methyltransferase